MGLWVLFGDAADSAHVYTVGGDLSPAARSLFWPMLLPT